MAEVAKPTKLGVEQAHEVPIHRIRITLTSKNVTNLEKGERPGLGCTGVPCMAALPVRVGSSRPRPP